MRTIVLRSELEREILHKVVDNVPYGMQFDIGPERKQRSITQNSLMWSSQLADIADQAWVNGRRFTAEVWHEHFKELYLPERDDPDLSKLVKDPLNYRKWDINPKGNRVLVGSTGDLSRFGFSEYLTQMEAYATGELGVMFTARQAA